MWKKKENFKLGAFFLAGVALSGIACESEDMADRHARNMEDARRTSSPGNQGNFATNTPVREIEGNWYIRSVSCGNENTAFSVATGRIPRVEFAGATGRVRINGPSSECFGVTEVEFKYQPDQKHIVLLEKSVPNFNVSPSVCSADAQRSLKALDSRAYYLFSQVGFTYELSADRKTLYLQTKGQIGCVGSTDAQPIVDQAEIVLALDRDGEVAPRASRAAGATSPGGAPLIPNNSNENPQRPHAALMAGARWGYAVGTVAAEARAKRVQAQNQNQTQAPQAPQAQAANPAKVPVPPPLPPRKPAPVQGPTLPSAPTVTAAAGPAAPPAPPAPPIPPPPPIKKPSGPAVQNISGSSQAVQSQSAQAVVGNARQDYAVFTKQLEDKLGKIDTQLVPMEPYNPRWHERDPKTNVLSKRQSVNADSFQRWDNWVVNVRPRLRQSLDQIGAVKTWIEGQMKSGKLDLQSKTPEATLRRTFLVDLAGKINRAYLQIASDWYKPTISLLPGTTSAKDEVAALESHLAKFIEVAPREAANLVNGANKAGASVGCTQDAFDLYIKNKVKAGKSLGGSGQAVDHDEMMRQIKEKQKARQNRVQQ